MLEKLFEKSLWSTRFITLLPVIFSLLGALVLFVVASLDLWHVTTHTFYILTHNLHPENFHENIVSEIIGAIDLYLIAIVMLIFSFGVYELFISEIDEANNTKASKILEIHSLDQLKDKLAKVIVMVLVVSFFKQVLHTDYSTPLEMLYFAISIVALSIGLYFLHKGGDH
jgi:uncharacterized protein (TIGR00645 family)